VTGVASGQERCYKYYKQKENARNAHE